MKKASKWWFVVAALTLTAAAYAIWWWSQPTELDGDFASGNGRIEATEIDIASKMAGRVAEIYVDEGDMIQQGQVVARIDTAALEAQLAQASALMRQAENAKITAEAVVLERISQKSAAQAVVLQRSAEFNLAQKRAQRSAALLKKNMASRQDVETDEAQMLSAQSALAAAKAQVTSAESGIVAARSQVIEAQSAVEAAAATVQRLQADMTDAELTAPRHARVQYRIVQPGEVVAAGGKILSTVDLSSVYMNFFLPERAAGRTAIGGEARIILDAAPQYVVPAQISYVASVAQFTPRSVETEDERQKLMFRVKARIDPALLRQYQNKVKTGVPGIVYVQLGDSPWPDKLAVRLPQ